MSKKYVYLFSEGDASMRELLGGKGANLAEMTKLGLPVPQGFTVTTEACTRYYQDGKTIAPEIVEQIYEYMAKLEEITGKKFGDPTNPLLVSVRSGARVSMPGMMDTILNLGLNDETVEGLAKATNNERFAYDSYRRFIQMFSDVVMGIDKNKFEAILDEIKEENGAKFDTDLTAENLKEVVKRFKELYKKEMGVDFPQDPKDQLLEAVKAVFRSWDNPRAIVYRRLNDIPSDWGTAVNVQSMVFGNMGNDSGTGVAFTRNPATGEKALFGEFLMNAQGEDVVAGIRTPQPISTLKETMPEVYNQFVEIAEKLEKHYKDMQDIEFTIERGKLYMLQTRNGKRTAQAALKVAVDLVAEGLIDEKTAVLRVDPKQLDQLLHPTFEPNALKAAKPVAKGLPASPGAASGKVYFTADEAIEAAKSRGEKVILVRTETSPDDIEGMSVAQGILTTRGGMTSHAAVVARGMGTACVVGCGDAKIDEQAKVMRIGDIEVHEGDYISIDGSTGNVYIGEIKTVTPELTGDFATLMSWADKYRKLKVKTNADIPRDAKVAVQFGAEGIGLCRTEHMFFDEDRIPAMREMIVSKTEEQRRKALEKLLPMQRSDFEGLFEVMGEFPVTIRLLDPPLHEFLPHTDEEIKELAENMGITFEELKATVESLKEFNPMLGHRGCRLAITYPEIAEMQTRAIIEAAINVKKKTGKDVKPQIMIPLVGELKELKYLKDIIVKVADEVIKENNVEIKYLVGTMIEVPRAALTADQIAKEAEFFSFGTNDLTQMTFGFSRDDAGKFLETYYEKKIYEFDPFAKLDQEGVGKLVEMGTKLGRQTRPDLEVGICGEHGGDPSSIEFCHKVGLDYVSASPYRVPIARLAAAQAAIKYDNK
ncbi:MULTISPECIES: pyruvate, phosphate dikinase [Thermoanaerobacter]|jgi:pyruvate,orthophosphate dikinase|uniref:Pyruvate, phosphate dikinase n=2 Tax=Thermoanaerobacter TaxID=1754 RepID=B0KA47_THEP3|nr:MULTISPECIES: pyruvate, phosphate dikinase [Thermoanaerobacter]ABY92641.1 pyruvate, phosphate dikinase [Thermoanaerobacter sp. X514]ABY95010.1 pyruvate, phosphate dikinase [Thermoanaerobacter pseudethanolicus ATCC 33223]ADV79959.1 pyruvate, phosphate dikinase [Thermoanaerobacter brockii subsp. finnii Ako-1]MBZ4656312.1 pyruvate, phosphate dikinase [Thermoanaerobacter sp.]HBW58947.1 pyruvate, phosphate dikinase [Thermoanaerobacter sp.]